MSFGFARKKSKGKKEPWIAPRLNKHVQIVQPVQTESSAGGFDQSYTILRTVWMGFMPIKHTTYMRWSSVDDLNTITHECIARRSAFDIIAGLNLAKTEYFLMMEKDTYNKGRLFRIRRMMDVDENHEYLSILIEEVEERGTGMSG